MMRLPLASKLIFNSLRVLIAIAIISCNSASQPGSKNKELIERYHLTQRDIPELPKTQIETNLKPDNVTNLDSISSTLLYPGVNARIFWGSGVMASVLQLEPNAKIPAEDLPTDKFVFVLEGSIDQTINGAAVVMLSKEREEPDGTHGGTPITNFVYLEKGTSSGAIAGPSGAKLLEVYSPLRPDYLKKAGVTNLPAEIADIKNPQTPNVAANKVYDLYDIQLTELTTGSWSRLISGKNMQLSFAFIDPNSLLPFHIHPEEQIILALRGSSSMFLLDIEHEMKPNDLALIPENRVHGGESGQFGFDALDIFWPVRPDYSEKEKAQMAAYHAIIPEDAKLELAIDGAKTKPGLIFTEGPKWMNGKLYFSNMYFDQKWNGSPQKSSTVEMNGDNSYRYITAGRMQTNGLYPYKNGHLAVCDMLGHRVVEMTTRGEVVKVIADKYEGKSLDGPNDLVVDAKGGIYFTDPQFTMEPTKFQPGRAVYYVSPEGKITRIAAPNEFAMPNGIVLSPDGKTLYINNTYDDEDWYPVKSDKDNYIWAYDVNADGTISNGRRFGKLFLTEKVLDRKATSSSADGMAIDKMGNLYVATFSGVQIFNAKGAYTGNINTPTLPVSVCFGGDDMKTLYIASFNHIYKIHTNMEGFVQHL